VIQHVTAARLTQPTGKVRVCGQAREGRRERAWILGRHEEAGFSVYDDVGDATQIAADHRHAIGHGLEQYDAQPLGVAPRVHDGR